MLWSRAFNNIFEMLRFFWLKVEVIFKILEVNFGILVEVICPASKSQCCLSQIWLGGVTDSQTRSKPPQITPKIAFLTRITPLVFPNLTKTLGWVGGFTDLGRLSNKTVLFVGGLPYLKWECKKEEIDVNSGKVLYSSCNYFYCNAHSRLWWD